jgi:hypothetical protein
VVSAWDRVGDRKRLGLKQFQCQLLREHHVGEHKSALGYEAQHPHSPAIIAELLHVHLVGFSDPIALAGLSASHLESGATGVSITIGEEIERKSSHGSPTSDPHP